MKKISRWLLKLNGWKLNDSQIDFPDKFVLIIAPHTSMWDFVWGRLMLSAFGLKARFLIKQEVFWFPLGRLLKWLGGMPVNRSRGNTMVQQVVEELAKHEQLVIAITPEGTRAAVKRWKKGFYRIAVSANIPIGVGYVDYSSCTYGIVKFIQPTGDFQHDFAQITTVYQGKRGKHPERFLVPELTSEEEKG